MSSILFRMHDFKTVFLRKHVEYTAGEEIILSKYIIKINYNIFLVAYSNLVPS